MQGNWKGAIGRRLLEGPNHFNQLFALDFAKNNRTDKFNNFCQRFLFMVAEMTSLTTVSDALDATLAVPFYKKQVQTS